MSLKCSIFGHSYGEAEVVRDREEDGSEVVITIRELETCGRCGAERVVSENKEVTTLETPSDIVGDDLVDDTAEEGEPAEEAADAPPGAGPEEGAAGPPGDPAAESEPDRAPSIKDAETGQPATDVGAAPTQTGREEPPADPAEDDGVILDEDDEDETEGRDPGEWPEEPDDSDDDWKPDTSLEGGTGRSSGPGANGTGRPGPDDTANGEGGGVAISAPDGTYHCPDCGFSVPVAESSLREGDFCPECHRGALEQRGE